MELRHLLFVLIEQELLSKKILVLHGSSFVKKGNAYLFIAPSGSGKSTIISNISKRNILSDDLAVLKEVSGKVYLFSSPFEKRLHLLRMYKSAPLKKIFLIRKASFNKRLQESTEERFLQVKRSNLLSWWLELKREELSLYKKLEKDLTHQLLKLVGKVSIETLYFTKDASFISRL